MSDVNFDRVYKLTLIKAPELVDIAGFKASFFDSLETVTEITDHRIQFKVQKHLKKEPNTAEITITNLSVASRDALKKGPTKIQLAAGYDGTPRLLFLGDVRFADSTKDGTEWLTKLQVADGGRAYAEARVNRSYGKGTPLTAIIGDIAKAFGVPMPPEVTANADLLARLPTGEVTTGYASDELTRLLDRFGLDWSFQNGRLQILRSDQIVPSLVRVINEDSGMIGSPEIDPPKITAPPKAGHRRGRARELKVPKLKVKNELYPELTPGEKLQVESEQGTGLFRLDVVTHEGDTHGEAWQSEIEATAA